MTTEDYHRFSVMFGRGGWGEGCSAATCNFTTRCHWILHSVPLRPVVGWVRQELNSRESRPVKQTNPKGSRQKSKLQRGLSESPNTGKQAEHRAFRQEAHSNKHNTLANENRTGTTTATQCTNWHNYLAGKHTKTHRNRNKTWNSPKLQSCPEHG